MFSLLQEPWLPVRRSHGQHDKIAPWQLIENDIVDLAYPRADFQGAAYQLLIGLLQTAYSPEEDADWQSIWDEGMDGDSLRQALEALAPAMQFGAQKPAFMQDYATLNGEPIAITGLLIDAPGANTLKLNKDHFVKRGTVQALCPHCAAMALFTLQTYAPAGGQGHRTSMRGGGPMTTLLMPEDHHQPLWRKLWLNVLPQDALPPDRSPTGYCDATIFPWLSATITSEKAGNIVTPERSHYLQAYWGMPRRIVLDFAQTTTGACDLCGAESNELLTHYQTQNYGVQYDGWQHPLTPYRRAAKDLQAPLLSVKGQPGGLSYREWLGLMLETENSQNRTFPAQVVPVLINRVPANVELPVGLWCFAYDMDNMKARCWYEHRLPVTILSDINRGRVQLVLELASSTLALLRKALKKAWFERSEDAKGDYSFIDVAYWQETEVLFRDLLHGLNKADLQDQRDVFPALRHWCKALYRYVIVSFDRQVFAHPDNPSNLEREVKARQKELVSQFYKQKACKELMEQIKLREEVTHD